ncbi:sulfatase, partial [bacterium]|nr:sulfatase [bacterium]
LVGGPPKERDEIGCLAEWDGTAWRIIERKQFLDVTGPGGIHGNPDGPAAGIQAPVWAIGWDRRSCILKLLDAGTWHTFRVPKASHAYDPAHGWYTEWPRIREVGEGKLLMDLHGMFFDFPKGFRVGHTGGLVPVASHLRYIPDFCDWNGTLVLAADEASAMANPMCGKSQSNLWFGSWADLKHFGPRSGWGGPWLGDAVKAEAPSDPFLVSGFDHLCLHLSTNAPANMPPAGVRTTGRFPITELPDELAGLTCVTIARGSYLEPAPRYAFTVNQNVTVFLAVDDRGGTPSLGKGWKKTALRMQWGRSYTDTVYAKPFPRGRVDIPGRSDTHGAAKHYAVPNTCFLRPEKGEAVALKVADLPVKLGGRATRPAPIVPTASAAEGMAFSLEVDRKGDGRWADYKTIAVPESGYAWHVFPPDFQGAWVRLKSTKAGRATAYFHCTSARPQQPNEAALFASLPIAGATAPVSAALIRPASHNTRLQVLAQTVGADGTVRDAGYWEVDETMAYHRIYAARRGAPSRADEVSKVCAVKQDFAVDVASAIMTWKGRRYRLPKGDAAFDKPFATGWPRGIREVQSERYLANIHGTFYEMPRDTGVPHLRPACTHNRRIVDYCSWRGLLVLSGARQAAKPDGNYFASADGTVGLWFGAVDDLWKLGKPVGRGGPWRDTAVAPGTPSDPYLMTGYDKKRVELSHDAAETVTFTLEVDVDHQGWNPYATVAVPAGKTVTHEFPVGYSAHWVRVKSSHACKATATFVYE